MTPVYIALLLGAVSAGIISRNNMRGVYWLIAFQAAFWLPVLYWDFSLPSPMLFGVICDAFIILALYKYGQEKWEEWCMGIYVLSILTTFAVLATIILQPKFDVYIFSWAKYLLNWMAILVIGSVSAFRSSGYDDIGAFANWTHFLGRERALARPHFELLGASIVSAS